LHKSNDPDVPWVRTGLEFQLNGFGKAFSRLKLSYLCELLHNCNVPQSPAPVFAV
jgi:hypothetical protein